MLSTAGLFPGSVVGVRIQDCVGDDLGDAVVMMFRKIVLLCVTCRRRKVVAVSVITAAAAMLLSSIAAWVSVHPSSNHLRQREAQRYFVENGSAFVPACLFGKPRNAQEFSISQTLVV